MDIDAATDAVEEAFAAFGVAAVYTPPVGEAGDCTAILWSPREQRRSGGVSFGGVEAAVRGLFVLVRKTELAAPERDGVFALGEAGAEGAFRIGEDAPIAHDSRGLVWRCAVSREP